MKKTTKSIQNFSNKKVVRDEKVKGGANKRGGFAVGGFNNGNG